MKIKMTQTEAKNVISDAIMTCRETYGNKKIYIKDLIAQEKGLEIAGNFYPKESFKASVKTYDAHLLFYLSIVINLAKTNKIEEITNFDFTDDQIDKFISSWYLVSH